MKEITTKRIRNPKHFACESFAYCQKLILRRRQESHTSFEKNIDPAVFDKKTVLLCSEDTHENCHRSLVVDYLNSKWGNIQAHHL